MGKWFYDGSYLEQFPQPRHGLITNIFCWAYRAPDCYSGLATNPAKNVSELLERVRKDLTARLSPSWLETDTRAVLTHIQATLDEPETKNFAQHIFEREQVSPELKAKLKADASKVYVEKHMNAKPPSEKQMAYLRGALKFEGEAPESMQAASLLIERLKKTK